MYTLNTTVKLQHTDAAGLLFFANYFMIIHSAYEDLLESVGLSMDYFIHKADYLVLLAHAEADYKMPLFLGQKMSVELKIEKIGHTSFVVSYSIKNDKNQVTATAKTVHVAADKKTMHKIPIPTELNAALSQA